MMMSNMNSSRIGYACAYAPVVLFDAAGRAPYRVLPLGDLPDRAGTLLHDNLCPHVKRIVDRAIADDVPDLAGMVVVNSCDAMRRMADAWRSVRPGENVMLLDLPATTDDGAVAFFAAELKRMTDTIASWCGREGVADSAVEAAIDRHHRMMDLLAAAAARCRQGGLAGGRAALQRLYNDASVSSIDDTIARLEGMLAAPPDAPAGSAGVPLYLFGNVMADPDAFAMVEASGARVAGDDFCTGSRMFARIPETGDTPYLRIARSLLGRPPCARTFDPLSPGSIAGQVIQGARECGARGVIAHTLKFCDPYIARMPMIRDACRKAGLPLLVLEGDCTLRSMGQQQTRIEAFIEMLG
jgi:benzoyl-CoA reductase/2-hydroxyglutaryl-CoA dehydratase subunit BcrC/BadD/HgdB